MLICYILKLTVMHILSFKIMTDMWLENFYLSEKNNQQNFSWISLSY